MFYNDYRQAHHTKLSTHIPNKKELHITAHASTPVLANEWTTCLPW
jgi:hypothetical protein